MAEHRRPAFEGAAIPEPPIPGDDGRTDAALRTQLELLAAGTGAVDEVLRALAGARLFVPVVASLEESAVTPDGLRHEKSSSMATVLVDSPEHGRALLAFSSIETIAAWRKDARPVAVMAPLAARAALEEGAASLVVDVAGPIPFALADTELLLMAAVATPAGGRPDPVLAKAVERVLAATPGADVARARVSPAVPDGPVEVWVAHVVDPATRADLVERLGRDRVVAALTPGGMRVGFRDTP